MDKSTCRVLSICSLALVGVALALPAAGAGPSQEALEALKGARAIPLTSIVEQSSLTWQDGLTKSSGQSFLVVRGDQKIDLLLARLFEDDPVLVEYLENNSVELLKFFKNDPHFTKATTSLQVVGVVTITCEGTCGGGCGVSGCDRRKVGGNWICTPCSCIPPLTEPPTECPDCVCKKKDSITIEDQVISLEGGALDFLLNDASPMQDGGSLLKR